MGKQEDIKNIDDSRMERTCPRLALVALGEIANDPSLKASYIAAMAAFFQEDEKARLDGINHQGYQERGAMFPIKRLRSSFNELIDYSKSLEIGDGAGSIAIRALVDLDSKRVLGETFLRIPHDVGEMEPTCEPLSYVRPDERGRGLGSAMFPLVMREALSMGCAKMKVAIREDNPASWRRFEKLEAFGVCRRDIKPSTTTVAGGKWRIYSMETSGWEGASQALSAPQATATHVASKLRARRAEFGKIAPLACSGLNGKLS